MTSSAPKKPTRRSTAEVNQKNTAVTKTTKPQRTPAKKTNPSKTTAAKSTPSPRNRKSSSKQTAGKDARSLQITLEKAYDGSRSLEKKNKSTRSAKLPATATKSSTRKSSTKCPSKKITSGTSKTRTKAVPSSSNQIAKSSKKTATRQKSSASFRKSPESQKIKATQKSPVSGNKSADKITKSASQDSDALQLQNLLQKNFDSVFSARPEDKNLQNKKNPQFKRNEQIEVKINESLDQKHRQAPEPAKTNKISWSGKIFKSLIGILLIIAAGWIPAQRLFQVSSVQAVVNARLITLRAPISGTVFQVIPGAAVGMALPPQTTIFKIRNSLADRVHLDRLQKEHFAARNEIAAIDHRLQFIDDQRKKIESQIATFTTGRIRQLEAQLNVIRAESAAAIARRNQSQSELRRTIILNQRGFSADSNIEKAITENDVLEQQIKVLNARQKIVAVELEAARQGTFVGDSYNDLPSSSQKLVNVNAEYNRLETEFRKWKSRERQLAETLKLAQLQFDKLSEATVLVPIQGKIWEMMTAPGEHVSKGQDLIRLLDCSSGIVTSTVSESVYNQLRIGTPAKFRFREGGREFSGSVIQLTGLAAARSNLAIRPSSLIKESYRVMVSVSDLGSEEVCHVGRTGRVIFDNKSSQ